MAAVQPDTHHDDDLIASHHYLSTYYAKLAAFSETSIADCIDQHGELISNKFHELLAKEEELELAEKEWFVALQESSLQEQSMDPPSLKKKRKKRSGRNVKSLRPYYFDDEGRVVYLLPSQTYWYLVYVKNPPTEDILWQKKFRRRFRLPHSEYLVMLKRLEDSGYFQRWYSTDASGVKASPIELLLLGALRYIGRGLTFDDLEEYTAINEETHRQFFHVFIDFGANYLYPRYVRFPTTAEEYKPHQEEFTEGGLHGAGFSTDATNVLLWRCSHNLKQAHVGFKNSHPARTYNLTCNHRRRILHTTRGHPSRWNDKTLAWLDEFLCGVREGRILQDVKFKLFEYRNEIGGPIRTAFYRGAWGLCDNGYHRWSCTQAPGKNDLLLTEKRLSQWIESFRKDVECVFGILKGRFRILKTGIRLEGLVAADNTWLTCCALHNILLEVDGLDERWEDGVPSDWEGELGENNADEMARFAPFAIQRLQDPESFGSRSHEQASALPRPLCGGGDDESQASEGLGANADETGRIYVNSLSYSDFRERLVNHFDILWRKHRIVWPRSKENACLR